MCALYFVCFFLWQMYLLVFRSSHSRGTSTALLVQMVTCYQRSPVECHPSPPSQRVSSRYSPVHDMKLQERALLSRSANLSLTFYFEIPAQIVTMGLFRTIALFYLGSFDSIVRRCMIQREQSKAANKRE